MRAIANITLATCSTTNWHCHAELSEMARYFHLYLHYKVGYTVQYSRLTALAWWPFVVTSYIYKQNVSISQ